MIKTSECSIDIVEDQEQNGEIAAAVLAAEGFARDIALLLAMSPNMHSKDEFVQMSMVPAMAHLFAEIMEYAKFIIHVDDEIIKQLESIMDDKVIRHSVALRGFVQGVYGVLGIESVDRAVAAVDMMNNELCAKILKVDNTRFVIDRDQTVS